METSQKEVLTSILTINLKLINKDITCVDDINDLLTADLSYSDKEMLNNTLDNNLQSICVEDFNFVKAVINESNLINKEYLLAKFQSIDVINNMDKYDIKQYLTSAFAKTYTGITSQEEYWLYQSYVRLSIAQGDSEIIRLAIDKIQAL